MLPSSTRHFLRASSDLRPLPPYGPLRLSHIAVGFRLYLKQCTQQRTTHALPVVETERPLA